jgi:hypothetical protein
MKLSYFNESILNILWLILGAKGSNQREKTIVFDKKRVRNVKIIAL